MLLVAAGGGGDAITASVLARQLGVNGTPVVMTYSWDRLLVDPVPGPRTVPDFDGLDTPAPGIHEVTAATTPRPPAGSSLPRLADELPARLLLLDPSGGAVGMAAQIAAAAGHFGFERIGLVDVGGDVLAVGGEPRLRSPLADLLALAACGATGLPAEVLVVGPGVDGEIDAATVLHRLDQLDAREVTNLGSDDFAAVRRVFDWHPSEATGLLAAAADGERGSVETRDAANRIDITDTTTAVFAVGANRVLESSPAAELLATQSLDAAAGVVTAVTGTDELGYETAKAARLARQPGRQPTAADLPTIDQYAYTAAGRGATHITVRRLAELIGVTGADGLESFRQLLASERLRQYRPPLYRVDTTLIP